MTLPGSSRPSRYSDEALVDAVRSVAEGAGVATLTEKGYDRLRDPSRHPSGVLVTKRLGWSSAVARAGLSSRTRARTAHRTDRVPDEHLAASVRFFLDTTEGRSVRAYEAHASRTGAPSAATVRTRLGSWPGAVTAALALEPGRAAELAPGGVPDRSSFPDVLPAEVVESVLEGVRSGESYESVGERHGRDGGWARSVAVTRSPGLREAARAAEVEAESARRSRLLERVGELARARGRGPFTVAELVGELGVSLPDVEYLATTAPADVVRVGRGALVGEGDLVEAVREVAGAAGLDRLSADTYDHLRDRSRHPASSAAADRVGWNTVVRRAGLTPTHSPVHPGGARSDRHRDELVLAHVRLYLDSPGSSASSAGYPGYAEATPGAPALSSVLRRTRWAFAVAAAELLPPGEAERVVAEAGATS